MSFVPQMPSSVVGQGMSPRGSPQGSPQASPGESVILLIFRLKQCSVVLMRGYHDTYRICQEMYIQGCQGEFKMFVFGFNFCAYSTVLVDFD